MLLKIISINFTQKSPQTLLKIDQQTLLEIGSATITQNRSTNFTQNRSANATHISVPMILCYVCMLLMYMRCYSKLVPQALFKIGSTNITQNRFHKCYSKLVSEAALDLKT